MNVPEISCIMCIYKETESQIQRAFKSVLNQTYSNFELIVAIDNPENSIAIELVEKYASEDSRITYFINSKNLGQSIARNLAIQKSKAEYIVIMDSDDESLPNRFEIMLDFMKQNPEVSLIGSGMNIILEKDHKLKTQIFPQSDITRSIKRVCDISGCLFFYSKSAFMKFGGYPEDYNRAEDYGLLISWILQGAKIRNVDSILYNYYIQDNFQSKSLLSLKQTIKLKWEFKKALKFAFGDYLYFLYDFAVMTLLYILPPKLYFRIFLFRNAK
jgi:glycosyltransferase involved in cell wall biosynthesis